MNNEQQTGIDLDKELKAQSLTVHDIQIWANAVIEREEVAGELEFRIACAVVDSHSGVEADDNSPSYCGYNFCPNCGERLASGPEQLHQYDGYTYCNVCDPEGTNG